MAELRRLSPEENAFLEEIAECLDSAGRDQLLADTAIALARMEGDFLSIKLTGYNRPSYIGHRSLPFEGALRDVEDGAMSLLVNIDQNDRLLALEFIWWENSREALPAWDTLTIVHEPSAW